MTLVRPNTSPDEQFSVNVVGFDIKGFNYGTLESLPSGYTFSFRTTNSDAFSILSQSGFTCTVRYNIAGLAQLIAEVKNSSNVVVSSSFVEIDVQPTEITRFEQDPPTPVVE